MSGTSVAVAEQYVASRKGYRRRQMGRLIRGLLFCSPFIAGFLALTVIPMFASLYFSFCRYEITRTPKWVGFRHYGRMLQDPSVSTAVRNTLLYAGLGVPLNVILGLLLALLLNQKVKALGIWRSIYYLPVVAPTVAYALMWRWMLSPNFGIINAMLGVVGIPAIDWLGHPTWIIIGFVLARIWACGGGMIIYLAGLQSIPTALYDAAKVDGAGSVATFRAVTFPMMTPVLFYNLIMGIVGAMQSFTFIWVILGREEGLLHQAYSDLGGTYMILLYTRAFLHFRMGYASAMAWVLFIMIMFLTLLVTYTGKRWVYYEAEWLTGR